MFWRLVDKLDAATYWPQWLLAEALKRLPGR